MIHVRAFAAPDAADNRAKYGIGHCCLTLLFAVATMLSCASEAQAAIALRAATRAAAADGDSSLTVSVPAGTTVSDVLIASIAYRPCSNSSGSGCTVNVVVPAGWTQIDALRQRTGGGTGGYGMRLFVYYRVVTGTEPANYTWTISGGPGSSGSTGGILSFSGVDNSSPIVADAGQTTATGNTHLAPSIDTGTVTNTVLVSTHVALSSGTWTKPDGMTEVVEIASRATPNDLGISEEMNYQLFSGSGTTGTRTARLSNPPAGDTGATHMLALRPAPPSPVVSSFNAYETSTAAGAISGIIKTKIAGATFSVDAIALNAAKTAIESAFTAP